MSSKHMGHIYTSKIPFYYLVLLIFFILLIFSVLTVLGFFVALAVGAVSVGVMVVRWLAHLRIRSRRFEDDGRTIILSEDEYRVIDKKG